jgi:hypothetical protein
VALSRSSHGRFQAWAIRAIAGFMVVYMLGAFGVPTQIPYIAVLIAVLIDLGRLTVRRGEAPKRRDAPTTHRGETIH